MTISEYYYTTVKTLESYSIMNYAFNNIGIIARLDKVSIQDTTAQLINVLRSCGMKLFVGEGFDPMLSKFGSDLSVVSLSEMGACCDLVIVVGGDGTLLSAAKHLVDYHVPVLGINRGRVGFLADIGAFDLESKIVEILQGAFEIEQRFMLEATLLKKNADTLTLGNALNDVVLHSGETVQMIEFELFIDKQFVYRLRADGLIVSTPTGSTAYSLSCGGAIMHPSSHTIQLVPMCPHTLSSRPIIIGSGSEIEIVITNSDYCEPKISCDGSVPFTAAAGDILKIKKKEALFPLMHPKYHNFFENCRSKLGWVNHVK